MILPLIHFTINPFSVRKSHYVRLLTFESGTVKSNATPPGTLHGTGDQNQGMVRMLGVRTEKQVVSILQQRTTAELRVAIQDDLRCDISI